MKRPSRVHYATLPAVAVLILSTQFPLDAVSADIGSSPAPGVKTHRNTFNAQDSKPAEKPPMGGNMSARGSDGCRNEETCLSLEEAVRSTLDRHPDVRLAEQHIRMRSAEVRVAAGVFDTEMTLGVSAGRTPTLFDQSDRDRFGLAALESNVTRLQVGATRRFWTGFTITPQLEFVRQDALGISVPTSVRTNAVLSIAYPIMRGGRHAIESATLRAARLQSSGSTYVRFDAGARSVYRVTEAYWLYKSAHETLAILLASEEKAQRLLQETRALVDAGERPAGDLNQLHADLADRFAARLDAEHRLVAARQNLGLEMGRSPDEVEKLQPPSTSFPKIDGRPHALESGHFISTIDRSRPDLALARIEIEAAEVMRDARRFDLRPAVTLRLDVGYSTLSENRSSSSTYVPFANSDVARPHSRLTLALNTPAANRRAGGTLEIQEALLEQARIKFSDMRRAAVAAIRTTIDALRTTSSEYDKIDEAVRLYTVAVENEKKRLQLGMSTQIDLLLVEERLRNTLLLRLEIETRYAIAISRLRFESGLLASDLQAFEVESLVEALLSSPSITSGR